MPHLQHIRKINSQKIESAIADFESVVDFELVPVIAKCSTPILHVKWMLSVLFIILFVGLIELYNLNSWQQLTSHEALTWVSLAITLSLFLGFLIAKFEYVQRTLTFKSIRDEHVHQKAKQVFFTKRLHETNANQGLLLFISMMEHRIVIMPDPRSTFEGCDKLTAETLVILQNYFKKNDYENGLLQAIAHLKNDLSAKFPKKSQSGNANQLANKLIWWAE